MTDNTVAPVENEIKGEEGTKGDARQNGDNEVLESLCGKNGEWETRKISIMGVVKRFISQLSYGQELTRCSPVPVLHRIFLSLLTML
jgi:hypothetical protein